MRCPKCDAKTKCVFTEDHVTYVWRRYACLECEGRFSTKEVIGVFKRGGSEKGHPLRSKRKDVLQLARKFGVKELHVN